MPTVGWIQESDTQRWGDAFPFKRERPEPIRCQLCGQFVSTQQSLISHFGTAHPLKQPILKIGREAGTQFVVRDRSALLGIVSIFATSCAVEAAGGQKSEIPPDTLAARFSKVPNATYRLWLRNERAIDGRSAEIEAVVRVAIPDPTLLAQVDLSFQKFLAVPVPTTASVAKFLAAVPPDVSAREYAGALADYVIGILIKEQDASAGTVVDLAEYKGKLSSARVVLNQFHTRLATSVLAAIDFNLNNFWSDAAVPVPALEAGHRFFTPFFTVGHTPSSPKGLGDRSAMVAACPVDHVTAAILAYVGDFPKRPTVGIESGQVDNGRTYPITEFDRPKIAMLLAASALLAGDHGLALPHLRALVHDYSFGPWAAKQLETFSKHE